MKLNTGSRRRFLSLWVITLLVGAVGVGLTGPGAAQAASPFVSKQGLGMGGLQQQGTGALQSNAARIAGLGVKWVRIEADWNYVQGGGRTSWTWTDLDSAINAARAQRLNILLMLQRTPAWARPGGTSPATPPSDPATFSAFAAAAVKRYAPLGIQNYEIWNEPNIDVFWQSAATRRPNAAEYARLLKAAYPAMKGATATPTTIVSGGLAPFGKASTPSGTRVNPLVFLQQMYANGARNSFDAVGWHPFTSPVFPTTVVDWNAWSQMGTDFRNPDNSIYQKSARRIMSDQGDAGKLVWMTEAGAATAGGGNTFGGVGPDSMSEANQKRVYQEAINLRTSYNWAGPIFFYTLNDRQGWGGDSENFFGVYRTNGTAKPAAGALQAAP